MDLDTPSELLLTPSVSFSTSVSSSTSDVFSLLLTQLHQCHTQRVTELEQKVNHLIKKFQKLLVLSREQKESALKYRKACQDLKKENHALKKALKEENRYRIYSFSLK
ncbi:hypothetical protein HOLleu_40392 [Holothuria leucospilota]|uniref:Uncharacterized protein n=1 Tax=Holothuria leucospilota TaxID=206669 RepID=A0A9Q0YE75_HOLLE|nr:hypothetical protein HOLleu_40392 [Holothuria leucospilota]